jgi:hypothetical protein
MVTMDKRESLKQLFIKTHTETAWPKILTDIQDTHTFILRLTLPVLSTKNMEGSISRINLLSLRFQKLATLPGSNQHGHDQSKSSGIVNSRSQSGTLWLISEQIAEDTAPDFLKSAT